MGERFEIQFLAIFKGILERDLTNFEIVFFFELRFLFIIRGTLLQKKTRTIKIGHCVYYLGKGGFSIREQRLSHPILHDGGMTTSPIDLM